MHLVFSNPSIVNRFILYILISVLLSGTLYAQSAKNDGVKDIAPEVYEYYKQCEKNKRLPKIIKMADTLYQMAESEGDKRTMCAALCFKPQYYLINDVTDSAEKYVEYCKRMSRELDQPKYYYFIWSRQVQEFFINHHYANALEQLRLMQEEAAKENSQEGIKECYRALSQSYLEQRNYELALEYNNKLIKYIEDNNIDDFNHQGNYIRQIDIFLNLKRYNEIPALIAKSRKITLRDPQKLALLSAEINYYTSIQQFATVESKIAELNTIIQPNQVRDDVTSALANYYSTTKQYDKVIETLEHHFSNGGTKEIQKQLYINALFNIPGRQKEAFKLSQEYFASSDSLRFIEQNAALAEFSALLDNQQLKEENARMRLKRSQSITYYYIAVIILLILFASTLVLILIRLKEKNRKLKSITYSKQAIEADLEAAGQIQAQIIPNTFPPFPNHKEFSLYAMMRPAKMVGGDLYDYYMVGSKLYFIVGDVSGKGIPASLIMSIVCSTFRTFAQKETNIDQIMRSINYAVGKNNNSNMFVTLMAGVLDTYTGFLTLCNAGHNRPILVHTGNATIIDMESGVPLGLIEHNDYPTLSLKMNPSDKLVVYTDGLTEAENNDHQQFELQRLQQLLIQHAYLDPTNLIHIISEKVDVFTGDAIQSDDLTILSIQFHYPYRNTKS